MNSYILHTNFLHTPNRSNLFSIEYTYYYTLRNICLLFCKKNNSIAVWYWPSYHPGSICLHIPSSGITGVSHCAQLSNADPTGGSLICRTTTLLLDHLPSPSVVLPMQFLFQGTRNISILFSFLYINMKKLPLAWRTRLLGSLWNLFLTSVAYWNPIRSFPLSLLCHWRSQEDTKAWFSCQSSPDNSDVLKVRTLLLWQAGRLSHLYRWENGQIQGYQEAL